MEHLITFGIGFGVLLAWGCLFVLVGWIWSVRVEAFFNVILATLFVVVIIMMAGTCSKEIYSHKEVNYEIK